jgi:hypothetical protein
VTWLEAERAAHLSHCLALVKQGGPGWFAYVEDKAAALEREEPAFAGLRAAVLKATGGPVPAVEGVNVGTLFRIPPGYLRPTATEKGKRA